MKIYSFLLLILIPVISHGWEVAVGTEKGIAFLEQNGGGFSIRGEQFEDESSGPSVLALATDTRNRQIFLGISSPAKGTALIQRIPLDDIDSEPATVVISEMGNDYLQGLAYDEYEKILYWTDSNRHAILRANLSVENHNHTGMILHQLEQNEEPVGIAVDGCRRYLFWTNSLHLSPSIERSDLDGSSRVTIIATGLFKPLALTLDPSGNGRIFWTDDSEGIHYKIETSNLDGTGRTVVIHGQHHQPYALAFAPAIGEDEPAAIFWSDWTHDAVWQISLDEHPASPKKLYYFRETSPYGLIVAAVFQKNYTFNGTENACHKDTAYSKELIKNTDMLISKHNSTSFIQQVEMHHQLDMHHEIEMDQPADGHHHHPTTMPNATDDHNPTDAIIHDTPQQESTAKTESDLHSINRVVNSIRSRVYPDFCLNGEAIVTVGINNGIQCKCKPGYSGHRCEEFVCHNYCIHGSCKVERKSDGEWEGKCTCRKGFSGSRCEYDPCQGYCLNGGRCRIEDDGIPQCTCPGSGQLVLGERCERRLGLLEKMCAVRCAQVSGKAASFIPLESINNEQDTEGPMCMCPSSPGKYIYYNASPRANLSAMAEREKPFESNDSPFVLVLGVLCIALLSVTVYLAFKVYSLRRLPRIKKRIIVSKGAVPLAVGCGGRGGSASPGGQVMGEQQQCEITIENCCNMNICETPCFEPQLRSPGSSGVSAKGGKEEKKMLLANMEVPKSNCGPCQGADELY